MNELQASATLPSSVTFRDSSAYNNGTPGWDVRVNTEYCGPDYPYLMGTGFYCIDAGRGYHDMSEVRHPDGWNYNNRGAAILWYWQYF